jgi:hypothetical protein
MGVKYTILEGLMAARPRGLGSSNQQITTPGPLPPMAASVSPAATRGPSAEIPSEREQERPQQHLQDLSPIATIAVPSTTEATPSLFHAVLTSYTSTRELLENGADPCMERGDFLDRSDGMVVRFLNVIKTPYELAALHDKKDVFLLLYSYMKAQQKTRVQKLYAQNEKVTAWIEEHNIRDIYKLISLFAGSADNPLIETILTCNLLEQAHNINAQSNMQHVQLEQALAQPATSPEQHLR